MLTGGLLSGPGREVELLPARVLCSSNYRSCVLKRAEMDTRLT